MTIQIAKPELIAKIEQLARVTGLSSVAAVESAIDRMLEQRDRPAEPSRDEATDAAWNRFDELIRRFDRLPVAPDAFDPLEWDENGLPK
ncbi:MAG TPA: type II toxin-antitoxin system VapB family antitoxin [Azospirillum sp.]